MTDTGSDGVRLLIADDHPVYRDGLRLLLGDREGIEVVGTATTGGEAVELAAATDPDVVIMDLRMPDLNGIEATRRIVRTSPHVGVLVLTMYEDDESVFAAMRAGARGYLLKGADEEEILHAVRAVLPVALPLEAAPTVDLAGAALVDPVGEPT